MIGILSQEDLERMPSEIYWNGLRALGMRRIAGTRDRWARQISLDRIASASDPWAERAAAPSPSGFDHGRPAPPEGFPACEGLNFRLEPEEVDYLRHRLSEASVDPEGHGREYSLFGVFLDYRSETTAATAWQHPRVGRLREPARGLLALAAALSHVMHGATHLYNARVAELALKDGGRQETRDRHAGLLREWLRKLDSRDVDLVLERIGELPELGQIVRHRVRGETTAFVREWAEHCRGAGDLLSRVSAIQMVERREVLLKGRAGTSRILSKQARRRWNGESGGALEFRWPVVRKCLNDLADQR